MLKFVSTLILFLFVLTIFSSTKVESRLIPLDFQDEPTAPIRFQLGQPIHSQNNDDQHEEFLHQKRKSEFLSSLYGLPYALVGKRNKS